MILIIHFSQYKYYENKPKGGRLVEISSGWKRFGEEGKEVWSVQDQERLAERIIEEEGLSDRFPYVFGLACALYSTEHQVKTFWGAKTC